MLTLSTFAPATKAALQPDQTAPATIPVSPAPSQVLPAPKSPGINRPDNMPNPNHRNGNHSDRIWQKLGDLQKKFDALTDAQRKQVYEITDELTGRFVALTKKYLDLGVLTQTEAAQITGVLQNGYEMAKKNGRVLFAFPPIQ
jgi:hypothetical protein